MNKFINHGTLLDTYDYLKMIKEYASLVNGQKVVDARKPLNNKLSGHKANIKRMHRKMHKK